MVVQVDINKLKAWGVHAFTASGVVFGLLALLAIFENNPQMFFVWMGVTLLIDGIDGTLARRYDVKNQVPEFDGTVLDLIIDYLTYVFIPAIFIYYFIPLPYGTQVLSIAIILLSSFFCFCNVNMKSKDNYFVGFPATWNIVALYFVVINPAAWVTFLAIIALAVLSVVPVKFLHPFRVRKAMFLNISFTVLWLISSGFLIAQYGNFKVWTLVVWWISSIYFFGFGLWQTIVDRRSQS